jgi:hypothetical protein
MIHTVSLGYNAPDPFPWADHTHPRTITDAQWVEPATCKTHSPDTVEGHNAPDWQCLTRALPLKRKNNMRIPVIRMEGDKIAEYFASLHDACVFEGCDWLTMKKYLVARVKYRMATEREATQWQR